MLLILTLLIGLTFNKITKTIFNNHCYFFDVADDNLD
jgi:hypothetical protein